MKGHIVLESEYIVRPVMFVAGNALILHGVNKSYMQRGQERSGKGNAHILLVAGFSR